MSPTRIFHIMGSKQGQRHPRSFCSFHYTVLRTPDSSNTTLKSSQMPQDPNWRARIRVTLAVVTIFLSRFFSLYAENQEATLSLSRTIFKVAKGSSVISSMLFGLRIALRGSNPPRYRGMCDLALLFLVVSFVCTITGVFLIAPMYLASVSSSEKAPH
ncbi:hypothetical protein CC2G_006580 [Coprinopsis cinerea AmutBmut pab1-1]|nr:hypothetical protein CC2G_006580 [Coprinopsis cinerea AmutBmut pab1-1]